MALYQPTNVIPSSYTKGTVDAVNDKMEISWQVNGNSAMTAFQIDFYLNDANSTPVTSTGRLTDNIPAGGFYGTDRFGRPQFFTWNANGQSWEEWSKYQLTNGNEYKYKITQWYKGENRVLRCQANVALSVGNTYYFKVPNSNAIVYFSVSSNLVAETKNIYYSTTNNYIWVDNGSRIVLCGGNYMENGAIPSDAIQVTANVSTTTLNELFVAQTSSNIVVTRVRPILTIYKSNEQYTNEIDFPNNGNLATSIGFFKAKYEQEQDAPIRWIRWQVATASKSNDGTYNLGEILADTGDIYTPTLNYEFNGFFNKQQYAIRTIGESESGQECNSNPDTDGWIYFNINIENQGEYSGEFTVQCLNKENATLLEWEGIETIPSTTSPQGYEPTISNGSVTLNGKSGDTEYSVTWDKQMVVENGVSKTVPMNFSAPWTTVFVWHVGGRDAAVVHFSGKSEPSKTHTFIDRRVITGLPSGEVYTVKIKSSGYVLGGVLSPGSNVRNYDWTYDNKTGYINVVLYAIDPARMVIANLSYSYTTVFEFSQTQNTQFGEIYNLSIISSIPNMTSSNLSYQNFSDGKSSITLFASYSIPSAPPYDEFNVEIDVKVVHWSVDAISSPQGTLFNINDDFTILKKNANRLNINNIDLEIPFNTNSLAALFMPTSYFIYFYGLNGVIKTWTGTHTNTLTPLTSVSIHGGETGATIDSISVYKGEGENILLLYQNPNFEPVWNDPTYDLYMTANFNGNLEGGTGTATGSGFRVYRQEVGKNVLTPIATVPSTVTSVKDYGLRSDRAYKYSLYAYDNNGAFMSAVKNEKVVATCFKNYSLLVCDYDETNDEYHVRKQYLFALNLSAGSVGNNNSPTLNANFTRYPTRMLSTQNYASGTLQGLIGAIYTVPALVEQIGNYKWMAKPSTMDYFDSVDLEQELYDLSTAPYQLFLRDMKGRLRMVATNGAITMTTNIKQKQQSISISFPWVEIGDASDVTIIQTPDDYGWNNDNQVLDVSLDVDVETGELSATYPYPYNGTKFYLTGVNKETLTAKTPLGITPAQFELSETATQPDDGELNATVKVNSEDN